MVEHLFGKIPADYYWRADVLPRELEAVFKPSWLCVGFTDDLQNHQDFITAQIGPHSIVVQNFKGELRAFRNVCSHRFSRIQTQRCGNRPMTCPYHGWTYDARGIPVGIPGNAKSFRLDEHGKAALALQTYSLEVCGRFVFVCMDSNPPALRDFLGRIFDDLEHFTRVCPHRISSTSVELDVNWKIGFENAAEGYHTLMVHKESLDATLSEDLKVELVEDHSIFYRALSAKNKAWWDRVSKIIHLKPSDQFPDSTNYVIFPNIVILATYGASFVLQTYDPLDVTRFRLNSTYWIADSRQGPARNAIVDSLNGFSEQIMGEDYGICRNVQEGVRDVSTRRPPLLGQPESRIAHFQESYARHMKGELT